MSSPTPLPTNPVAAPAAATPGTAPALASGAGAPFNQAFGSTLSSLLQAAPAGNNAAQQGGNPLPQTGNVLPFGAAVTALLPAAQTGLKPTALTVMQQLIGAEGAAPGAGTEMPAQSALQNLAMAKANAMSRVAAPIAAAVAPALSPGEAPTQAEGGDTVDPTARVVNEQQAEISRLQSRDLALIAQQHVAVTRSTAAAPGDTTLQKPDALLLAGVAPDQRATGQTQQASTQSVQPGAAETVPINPAANALAGKLMAAGQGQAQGQAQLNKSIEVATTPVVTPASNGMESIHARADFRGLVALNMAATVTPEPLPSMQPDTLSAERWSRAMGERVVWMVNAGNHKATIQLHPAELGQIELRVTLAQQSASVEITAQHAATRDLLETMSPRLMAALESSGIKLEDLKVQTGEAGKEGGREGQPAEGQFAESGRENSGARPDGSPGEGAAGDGEFGPDPGSRASGISLLNVMGVDTYA